MDPLPINHPYSDQLIDTLKLMFIVDSQKRPSAKDLLELEIVEQMRELMFNDIEKISFHANEKILMPIFLPSNKNMLVQRIQSKIFNNYEMPLTKPNEEVKSNMSFFPMINRSPYKNLPDLTKRKGRVSNNSYSILENNAHKAYMKVAKSRSHTSGYKNVIGKSYAGEQSYMSPYTQESTENSLSTTTEKKPRKWFNPSANH